MEDEMRYAKFIQMVALVTILNMLTGCGQFLHLMGANKDSEFVGDPAPCAELGGDADGDGFCAEGPDWDCNDTDPTVYPGSAEYCNGVNDNCDRDVDEDSAIDASEWFPDSDADGHGAEDIEGVFACNQPEGYARWPDDCDDTNSTVYDEAWELCDGEDNDCDGLVDGDDPDTALIIWYADRDNDGFGDPATASSGCDMPEPRVVNNFDCDDTDANANPDADEYCDGHDDDCDGDVDEDEALDVATWYRDADGDGYGDPASTDVACYVPTGYAGDSTDCDDNEPTTSPGAPETCDAVDNDCDGTTDENDAIDAPIWFEDADGDGFGDSSSTDVACYVPTGYVADDTDCDDANDDIHPTADELCNTVDDDCDGTTDENDSLDALTWYADGDSDGFGNLASTTLACTVPAGYTTDTTDCNDSQSTTFPGATEYCDGHDDDCDGTTDEDDSADAPTWYHDADADGFGDSSSTDVACYVPTGFVSDDTDCDDAEASTNPGASEYCDGHDDDCDSAIDEDDSVDALTWYADTDVDDYGDPLSTTLACAVPAGYVDNDDDCDDSDADVNPVATEVCDLRDNNCNGLVDSADPGADEDVWHMDWDHDGFGDLVRTMDDCTQPSGFVADSTDCDDTDPDVNPEASEICNGYDDDCDGTTDVSAVDATNWYLDSDGDGYGDPTVIDAQCDRPTGYVANDDDCNDAEALAYTGAVEVCDSVDNDCNGLTDDADPGAEKKTWYADDDADGYGDATSTTLACLEPSGYVDDNTDCDDTNEDINPAVTENVWTVWDDDCDGYAHDDGTVYTTTMSGTSITFTGPNLVASADADFEGWSRSTTAWDIYASIYEHHTLADLTVVVNAWSGSYISGSYSTIVFPGAAVDTNKSECESLDVTGLTSGSQYGFVFLVQSSSSNEFWVYTDDIIDSGTSLGHIHPNTSGVPFVTAFTANATSEVLVLCHGRLNPNDVMVTHVWVGPAS
ncbi:MAG: putative metal-binding motif-containing protein [Patescibacteria group bacterium]